MDYFLTIAASDNSGGAGIQQDMKVAHNLDYWALSAITGITVQNFDKVFAVEAVKPDLLKSQIMQCLQSFQVKVIKIGAICSYENIQVIAECLNDFPVKHVVLDPVLFASDGTTLSGTNSLSLLIKKLFPLTELITPNRHEFELLTNKKIGSIEDGIEIAIDKCREWNTSILLKGGHFNSPVINEAIITPKDIFRFRHERKTFSYSHGTGCTLSSALACFIGKNNSLCDSYSLATNFLVNHFEELQINRL